MPTGPHFVLERAPPPARGVAERFRALDNPKHLMEMRERVYRGIDQGGDVLYNMEPLRQHYHAVWGPERGEELFNTHMDFNGAVSPRSTTPQMFRAGSYYDLQNFRGTPVTRASGPPPHPYGHFAQQTHMRLSERIANRRGLSSVDQPKTTTQSESMKGNLGSSILDSNVVRNHDLRTSSGAPLNAPGKQNYGYLENLHRREALEMGLHPAQYTAGLYLGGGERTGLRSAIKPLIQIYEDRLKTTADLLGTTPEKVADMIVRKKISMLELMAMIGVGAGSADVLGNPPKRPLTDERNER